MYHKERNADLLGESITGKHMGLVLLACLLVYSVALWRNGNSLKRVLASCVGVFIVSRGGAFLVRQAVLKLIGGWNHVDQVGVFLLVFLMPMLLYITIPVLAFRRKWFGIRKQSET